MREIKFRAWDKNDGMFYDIQNGIEFSDLSHYTFKDFLGNPDAIGDYHKWKVMQFTGLKDKNGKEVYEKDKIKVNGFEGEVYWYRDGWFIQFEEHSERLCKTKEHYIEIIGNIYENKDLIK